MDDARIIALYWERSEDAITASEQKYGSYCRTIAQNILHSECDTQDCLNDTWLHAWNAMPPQRPNRLSAFFGRITRNLALDRYRSSHAARRGSGETALCLDELAQCVGDSGSFPDTLLLRDALNRFLQGLQPQPRKLFLLRYWYMLSVRETAVRTGVSEGAAKMSLQRTRTALREFLEKEELL